LPKKDLKLNINKKKLADALNLGKFKDSLANDRTIPKKKDIASSIDPTEETVESFQEDDASLASPIKRKARMTSVFERKEKQISVEEIATSNLESIEEEPQEKVSPIKGSSIVEEKIEPKEVVEAAKEPVKEEPKPKSEPQVPKFIPIREIQKSPLLTPEKESIINRPVRERLGPTGRHVRDFIRKVPPKPEVKPIAKPVAKNEFIPKQKPVTAVVDKEADRTKKALPPRKFKDFKEVKPVKKSPYGFDARGKKGLADNDAGAWRKKRKNKQGSSLPEQSPVLPSALTIRTPISIKYLAKEMKLKASELIAKLFAQGIIVTINDSLEDETTIKLLGHEFNCEITIDTSEEEKRRITEKTIKEEVASADPSLQKIRPPVIAFMGHVDHGKTSLIDYIRKSNVAAGEAGLITQHIGAFRCSTAVGDICILDTPGHEAFSAMRARGADVTDIVVLVIAGDEGIRVQTKEAIRHAKAAGVTIVVAVNKKDKPNYDLDNVYRQLAEVELLSEAWGGQTITVPCSAKTGEGIKELLEMIALQSEVLELNSVAETRARGTVLESEMHKGLGTVATLLIQNGTLRLGDSLVFSQNYGRVKTMRDEKGKDLVYASPSTPVEVTGLSGLPEAGEEFIVVSSEKEAKEIAEARRLELSQKTGVLPSKKVSLESLMQHAEDGKKKTLNLLLRADTQGSLEALRAALLNIRSDKIHAEVIFTGIGEISESDVQLAAGSNAVIIGFHTQVEAHAESLVKQHNVDVKLHNIIYHAVDEVRDIMTSRLDKVAEDKECGKAVVQALFKSSKHGQICGCLVTEGKIHRNNLIRVRRGKEIIHKGPLQSIRRVQDDVREVSKGVECGIILSSFEKVKEDDIIEAYEVVYRSQEL
jgi:translation initiation factor IF-2